MSHLFWYRYFTTYLFSFQNLQMHTKINIRIKLLFWFFLKCLTIYIMYYIIKLEVSLDRPPHNFVCKAR